MDMTIQLVKPVACCRLERRARYMMSSWTQATAGMFVTDTSGIFETHSFERAKWMHPRAGLFPKDGQPPESSLTESAPS